MTEFFTALCASINRKELATAVIAVQTYRHARDAEVKINSVQTLLKKQVGELKLLLHTALGEDLILTADGVALTTPLVKLAKPARVKKAPRALTGNLALATKNARTIHILKPLDDGNNPVAIRCKLFVEGMTIAAFNAAMHTAGLPGARRQLRRSVRNGQIEYR